MSRGQSSDLPSVNGLPAKNKKSPCVQMGGLCWLHDLVISVIPWVRGQISVPAVREMGCSVRGTDLAVGSLTCWVFFGGDVPGKPVCSGAGVYTLHPRQGELALVPVCSGSYQSYRIAPRLYTGWHIH